MSRKETGFKHGTLPDPRFESEMVARFINMVMRDGKKSVAEHIVYCAIEELEARGQAEPLEAVEKALENAAPSGEGKSRRLGAATYQVPGEGRTKWQQDRAMRGLIAAGRRADA